MKKIFGISLGALFAAVPMMAGAANIDLTANGHGNIEAGDQNKAVSVSYVKGAYNELGAAINTKQDQLKNGETNISSAVSSAVRTEGADNSTLVTELAVRNAIVSAISSANNAATSAATSALNSAKSYADSVASAAETAAKSYADGLDSAMDARVDALESAGYITKDVNDLTNYTTTTDLQSAYATKTGVEKTINNVSYTANLDNTAVSGTVTAMSEWGSSATSAITMSGSVTNSAVTVTRSAAASYIAQ